MTDDEFVLDIVNAARRALQFVHGLDEPAFLASELHQAAVVRQLEIIGEAAGRLTQEFRDGIPQVP